MEFIHNAKASQFKAISLFAGAGGCSLGFYKYGVDIISAYEYNDEAIDTYNRNFSGDKCHKVDLSTCNFEEIRDDLGMQRGQLDFIIGGPPCQGFTTAGKRSEDDPRNRLLYNYVNAINIFYPRWFMMENVEGVLTTSNGDFIVESVKKMVELGYTITIKKVYMQEYGVPQRRKRVIVIGNREGKKFSFPTPTTPLSGKIYRKSAITLRDAIEDLATIDIPEINHIRKKEEGINLKRITFLKQGQKMKDLPKELQHKSFAKRAARRVCDGTPTEKRGGAPSGIQRLYYDEPSLTITSASTSEFIHPTEDRKLTIRECARIQTFPDDFIFCGNESEQEKQIGNAIPPLFANCMADKIFECDRQSTVNLKAGLLYYDLTKSSAMSPALSKTCSRLNQYLISSQLTFDF